MWDEATARDYDLMNTAVLYYEETQRNTVNEVVSNISRRGIRRPRILEIGCGTGNTTRLLLEKIHRPHLVCVDSSDDMARVALNRISGKDIYFSWRDGLKHLGHYEADNSLDVVFTAQTLHNIARDERANYFSEISRVLKVGGVFVDGDKFAITNPTAHYDALRCQIMNIGVVLGNAKRSDLIMKLIDHYLDDNQPHKIFYESEFMEKCREFGMKPKISYRAGMNAVGVAEKYSLK